ncbi:MAG TPA: threonine/serine exporter family protein, partial [Planococcus sp. (in: firmicutes)]|nr:threonine/serine exporter family protein [Planococcus sp. (in: firmicutes)]
MAQITETRRELALDCFLLAGKVMMESGAETYRIEDTMIRMAVSQKMTDSHCFITPGGIMFSPSNDLPTRFVRIKSRRTDLERVALINSVSRKLVAGELTLQQAYDEMLIIDQTDYMFAMWIQVLAAGMAGACFLILMGGNWADLPFALVIGGTGFFIVETVLIKTRVKFFAEFVGSVAIGTMALTIYNLGFGTNLDT